MCFAQAMRNLSASTASFNSASAPLRASVNRNPLKTVFLDSAPCESLLLSGNLGLQDFAKGESLTPLHDNFQLPDQQLTPHYTVRAV